LAAKKARYAKEHAERLRIYKREWAKANPEKRAASKRRTYENEIATSKGRLDRFFRRALRRRLDAGVSRSSDEIFAILGYTLDDLMRHIERQFGKGMTWGNYGLGDGKWHIDHIRPLASFSYESPQCPEFRAAWALSNLQPLWQRENLKKGAKIVQLL
jgi:hypothetical protein